MDKKRLFLLLAIIMAFSHLTLTAESRKLLRQTGGIPAILDENDHQIMDGQSKEERVVASTRRWALDELDYETGANHKHDPRPRLAQRMD